MFSLYEVESYIPSLKSIMAQSHTRHRNWGTMEQTTKDS